MLGGGKRGAHGLSRPMETLAYPCVESLLEVTCWPYGGRSTGAGGQAFLRGKAYANGTIFIFTGGSTHLQMGKSQRALLSYLGS